MQKITETIQKINAIFNAKGITPHAINNGLCEDFAMMVIEQMGGYSSELEEVATESFDGANDLPGHVWIYYQDKFYDAECPQGVKDWRELPIFKRLRGTA